PDTPEDFEFAEAVHAEADLPNASLETIYDSLYLAELEQDNPRIFAIARRLVESGGVEEQRFFLGSLKMRGMEINRSVRDTSININPKIVPLSESDLQLARDCYYRLNQQENNEDLNALYGGNIIYAANGMAYANVGGRYIRIAGGIQGGILTILVDELRLAGHADEARKLVDERLSQAVSPLELVGAMQLLLNEGREEELPEFFRRWQQTALQQIAETPIVAGRGNRSGAGNVIPLSQAMLTIQQWMGKLGADGENAQVLSILADCLTVAEAEAEHRHRAESANNGSSRSASSTLAAPRVTYYSGSTPESADLNFPPASIWFDQAATALLYQAFTVLRGNDVSSDLTGRLRQRCDETIQGSAEVHQVVCRQIALASTLWWNEQQDDAVDLIAQAAAIARGDVSLQFSLAEMHENRQEYDEALTVLERIQPVDQQILRRKELAALNLAERLGDVDRARSAAERLFGLRLDSETQVSLAQQMQRLGLSQLADAVLARTQRTAASQTSSLGTLMVLYQGQGKSDEANQLAHMILRKTTSPVAANGISSRNPMRTRTQDSLLRTQALQQLNRSGALSGLIDQQEAQLQRSPDAIAPVLQLIEYYQETGEKDKAISRLLQAIQLRPDSPILLLVLAKTYEQAGKASEACDQYLRLLKIQPAWVAQDFYETDRVFRQAGRQLDFAKALSEVDLRQISEPHSLLNT
ncbi:MAG: hypothetical protein KDA85_15130, partial [Planctomycetaceae bacterium]|nr:hypothetical protein [Planctomycetaceae bacterium]